MTVTAQRPAGMSLMVAALVMLTTLLLAYREPLLEMQRIWATSETYAHGYFIAPMSLWLLWQLRGQLRDTPQRITLIALLPLLAAGALWTLAALADIDVIQQFAVVTMLVSALWFLGGHAWFRVAWFPCLFLFLAVPFGDGLTPVLINYTADFVVAALRASGVPVYREGTFFIIPSGSWSVVTGCSGMRYLMATLTVGMLFAYLNYRALWKQVLFVVVAVVTAILANWLRAYGIVMIAHLSDMTLALGIDHYIYGWVFFGLVIFLLMLAGGRFSERDAFAPRGLSSAPAAWEGVAPGALLLLLASLVLPVMLIERLPPPVPQALPSFDSLLPAATWREVALPVNDWTPHYVGEPTLVQGAVDNDGRVYGWHLAWYPQQDPGNELIQARNRLVNEKFEAWRVYSRTERRVDLPGLPRVIETVLKKREGQGALLVWQWYWLHGETAVSPLGVKWLGVQGLLSGRGNAGASVLAYLPLPSEDELSAARPLLTRYVTVLAPVLQSRLVAHEP